MSDLCLSSTLKRLADNVGISDGAIQTAMEAAIRKGMRPTTEGLASLADEFSAIQDPIAQTEFLMKNFGWLGADLAPLMKLGAEGIREGGIGEMNRRNILGWIGVIVILIYALIILAWAAWPLLTGMAR